MRADLSAAEGEGQGADPDAGYRWMTIAAAARALGVSERAVRRRVERGTLESRREEEGNRVRTLVRVAAPHGSPHGDPLDSTASGAEPRAGPGAADAELREQVARLEERFAASEAARAAAGERIDELRAELAAERARVDQLLAVLAEQPERRYWPGLKVWWRRFWDGGG